jgi:hypothetical protein
MSYVFDVMQEALAKLRERSPPAVRDGEMASRLEFLIYEIQEADSRRDNIISRDQRVGRAARKLSRAEIDQPQYLVPPKE